MGRKSNAHPIQRNQVSKIQNLKSKMVVSSSDRQLIHRDPDLIGLQVLLDVDAVAATLTEHNPSLDLHQIRKTYIRYKPATNCLVGYEATVGGKPVFLYAKTFSTKSANKLKKYRQPSNVVEEFGDGHLILDAERIVISAFPNDYTLPLLPLWDAGSTHLQTLFPNHPQWWQGRLYPLRYKPERRCVAQLWVENQVKAVIKTYTPTDYQQSLTHATVIHAIAPNYTVAPLGYSESLGSLAFPWIAGTSLHDAIIPSSVSYEAVNFDDLNWETIAHVGMVLAQIHRQTHHQTHSEKLFTRARFTRTDEVTNLVNLAADLSWLCPPWKNRIQAIVDCLSALLVNTPPIHVLIHGDFNAEQVLLNSNDSESITFIDFDRAMYGDAAMDIGSFNAKLHRDELNGMITVHKRERIISALISGYHTVSPHHIANEHIQLYTAIGLFRLASEPFRHGDPNWIDQIDRVLERIELIIAPIFSNSVQTVYST